MIYFLFLLVSLVDAQVGEWSRSSSPNTHWDGMDYELGSEQYSDDECFYKINIAFYNRNLNNSDYYPYNIINNLHPHNMEDRYTILKDYYNIDREDLIIHEHSLDHDIVEYIKIKINCNAIDEVKVESKTNELCDTTLQACHFADNAYYLNTTSNNRCDINDNNCGVVHEPLGILEIIGICILCFCGCGCLIVVYILCSDIIKTCKLNFPNKEVKEKSDEEKRALVGIV